MCNLAGGLVCSSVAIGLALSAGAVFADAAFTLDRSVMSEKYRAVWNDALQAKIDADIEAYRKADAEVKLDGAVTDGEVKIEQISHAFFFGAHCFNYNQLGRREWNDRYKALFNGVDIFAPDALFNSATAAFYWRTLEPYPFACRYAESYEDTEEYWNRAFAESPEGAMRLAHWRRPAPDPVVSFLKTVGCRIHGHPIVWGNPEWHVPSWIWDDFTPEREKLALETAADVKVPRWNWRLPMGCKDFERDHWAGSNNWYKVWRKVFERLDERQVAELVPSYVKALNEFTDRRMKGLAERYGSRVDSWDVVNESATDWGKYAQRTWPAGESAAVNSLPITASGSCYGPMPANYAYNALTQARQLMRPDALLNINEYNMEAFPGQIADLAAHGATFDVVGSQMHLFDPQESRNVAAGEYSRETSVKVHPAGIEKTFAAISKASGGSPIHLSEITITAPGRELADEMIQAVILHDCYRAWFAVKDMNGITWWNVVDDCGAPGEPSISGLFTREMRPKAAYFAMRDLIQREWRTVTAAKASADGVVKFRGFRGRYRLTWKDASGAERTKIVDVK